MSGLILTRDGARRQGSRGAEMLEFAILFPFFLFMILFTIDMGHVVLVTGQVQDATASAARYGAQLGGATNRSERVFRSTITATPGLRTGNIAGFQITTGGTCARSGSNSFVTLRTRYNVPLITPGLAGMLNLTVGNGGPGGTWQTGTSAVARCEITAGS